MSPVEDANLQRVSNVVYLSKKGYSVQLCIRPTHRIGQSTKSGRRSPQPTTHGPWTFTITPTYKVTFPSSKGQMLSLASQVKGLSFVLWQIWSMDYQGLCDSIGPEKLFSSFSFNNKLMKLFCIFHLAVSPTI